MNKKEKKKERKERKKVAREAGPRGKWLSNVNMQDAKKIKKTFSQVIEGPPRRTDRESVEELAKDGLVGLYQQEKKNEAC